ncbi:MAG: hypothetical protein AAFY66_09425 [Pseudomonadota bacterium]
MSEDPASATQSVCKADVAETAHGLVRTAFVIVRDCLADGHDGDAHAIIHDWLSAEQASGEDAACNEMIARIADGRIEVSERDA